MLKRSPVKWAKMQAVEMLKLMPTPASITLGEGVAN
jgi:hypothetical protein